jgi:hypothetical protein
MLKKLMMMAPTWWSLEEETRLPRSLSVRNDENIESIAEKVDDEDYIRS